MLDAVALDARQSFRSLRRSLGFSCVFVITIGLAIGATTTTASLLEAIVLRSVAAPQPDRLVSISVTDPRTNQPGYIYTETFQAYSEVQRSLSKMSMYFPRVFRIEADGAGMDAVTEAVTADYFDLLGVRPALGRFLSDRDGSTAPVMVVSDRFRRKLFADGTDVIGRTVKVAGYPITIVGATPQAFEGLQVDGGTDIFITVALMQSLAGFPKSPPRSRNVIGRLAPGVTLSDARTEVLARWPAIQHETVPSTLSEAEQHGVRAQKIDVQSIASGFSPLRDRYGPSIAILLVLTAVLLAVACVNLAGLLLVRSVAQRRQLAVRLAVGASRRRALCPILLSGVVLTSAGFLLSIPVTWWTTRELGAMFAFGRTTPFLQEMTPSGSLLGIAAIAAVLIGLAIGILPAWHATRAGTTADLHAARTVSGGLGRSGRLLLMAQVSLSLILVIGAGLFAKTLANLRDNYATVTERNVLFTRISRVPGDRGPITATYLQTLIGELREIPGVQAAAFSVFFPALFQSGVTPTNRYSTPDGPSATEISALTEYVSPGFFDTFGIARITGREFTWADTTNSVAMITQSVATTLFGSGDAVGRRVRMSSASGTKEFEIIGVVIDAPFGNIREPRQATVFRPIQQEPSMMTTPMAHVRFDGDVKMVAAGYRRAVQSHGRHYVNVLFTLNDFVNSALLKERMIAWVSAFISVLIVVLACIGTYSMLAYMVTSRIRELGIRSALGATRAVIVRTIVREGMAVAIPGIACGVVAALAAARLVRAQLYGVDPQDPWTIVAASLTFILTVAIASLVPALRASNIDTIHALRQE